jgi:hypothetical protein
MGRSATVAGLVLAVSGGCGPVVPIDDAGGGEAGSTSDDESSGESTGSSGTVTGTASATATSPPPPGTTADPSTTSATTDVTGDASSTGAVITCDDLELESVVCLTIDQEEVVLFGLDSGASCSYATIGEVVNASSLAWQDDGIVACPDSTKSITFVDLTEGFIDATDVQCDGVGSHPSGIVVKPPFPEPGVRLFASFEAILADEDIASFAITPMGNRLAVAGDVLYAARHADDNLEMWSLSTETHVRDLALESFTVIDGMSIVGDVVYVEAGDETIVGFDLESGALVAEHPLVGLAAPQGLACRG